MEINKQEANYLLEVISKSAVQVTIADVQKGLSLNEFTVNLIDKLKGTAMEEVKPAPDQEEDKELEPGV